MIHMRHMTLKRLACASAITLVMSLAPAALQAQNKDEDATRVHTPAVVGDLRLHTFTSKVFANVRTLRVLLPEGYDLQENRNRRYAVLYLADGQNLFDPATSVFGPSEWRVDEIVRDLVAERRIPPLIVVGVDNAGRTARGHEYLPYPDTLVRTNPAFDPSPQGKRYPDFLINEVMPYINGRYRTLKDAGHTGIGGSSYGALISTYVVAARPGVFGRLLSESATYRVFNYADAPTPNAWPERVYLGVGTNEESRPGCRAGYVPTLSDPLNEQTDEMLLGVLRFDAFLRKTAMDAQHLRLSVAPCGTHSAAAWSARLPDALTFLFGDANSQGESARLVNRKVSLVQEGGSQVVRLDQQPDAGMLWYPGVSFGSGTIELDVRGQDVQQRSFIGVAFHRSDDQTWEVVWLRPFNFKGIDADHHAHAVQYASYPDSTWQVLRAAYPGRFEAAVEPVPDPASWVHLRIDVRQNIGVFLNNSRTPTLNVRALTKRTSGAVGLWVGDCSPGDFKNVVVTPEGAAPIRLEMPASVTAVPLSGDRTPNASGCM